MTKMNTNDRVREWEEGLPSPRELTPLSQCLISPELASAFSITSEMPQYRTLAEVLRDSQSTFDSLRRSLVESDIDHGRGLSQRTDAPGGGVIGAFERISKIDQQSVPQNPLPVQAQALGFPPSPGLIGNYGQDGKAKMTPCSYDRKSEGSPDPGTACLGATDSSDGIAKNLRVEVDMEPEEAESGAAQETSNEDQAARTLKRPRLVWTPELHKRFVEAVAHLGIKNAVPKTIMQLMNVDGLTRENVASHLQKYRLYLKRMQGLSNEGPSASDQLFASTPVPPSLAASARFYAGIPGPGHMDEVIPVPVTVPRVPVPLGRPHLAGSVNTAGPYTAMDPNTYNALARATPQRYTAGDQKELLGNNQGQPVSSSHHMFRLYQTGNR